MSGSSELGEACVEHGPSFCRSDVRIFVVEGEVFGAAECFYSLAHRNSFDFAFKDALPGGGTQRKIGKFLTPIPRVSERRFEVGQFVLLPPVCRCR